MTQIEIYQHLIGQWADQNFGTIETKVDTGPAGLAEEVGEMCRAWVKRAQGIRGTREEWSAEYRKEAADVFIKLCQICHDEGFNLSKAIYERWDIVRLRDFKTNPIGHGIEKA